MSPFSVGNKYLTDSTEGPETFILGCRSVNFITVHRVFDILIDGRYM